MLMTAPGPFRADLSVAAAHLRQDALMGRQYAASHPNDAVKVLEASDMADAVAVLLEAIDSDLDPLRPFNDNVLAAAAGVAAVVVPEETK